MNVHCIYCNTKLHKSTKFLYKMLCLCEEDYRFLNADEVLLGFHHDKVYLLDGLSNNVYEKQTNDLQKSKSDVR